MKRTAGAADQQRIIDLLIIALDNMEIDQAGGDEYLAERFEGLGGLPAPEEYREAEHAVLSLK